MDERNTTIPVKARATYIDPAHPEVPAEISAALDVPVVGDMVSGLNGVITDMSGE